MAPRSQKKLNKFDLVRDFVKIIPKGKVCTYGQVATYLSLKSPRVVGWALRGNQNPLIPCHRVVQKTGTLSPAFSLGGRGEQRRRLLIDCTPFLNKFQVDLSKALFIPSKNPPKK